MNRTIDEGTDPDAGPGTDPTDEATTPPSSGRSRTRRPTLRRQLALTLVGVSALSILLVGGLNFVAANDLLVDGTTDSLVRVGEARAQSIELGAGLILEEVAVAGADPALAAALEELAAAFASTDDPLDAGATAELEDWYRSEVTEPLEAIGLPSVPVDGVLPQNATARYLQYHYTVSDDFDGRRAVDDAGDGSPYSAAHATHHRYLRSLADTFGFTDLLLIDASTDQIVYSTEKRIDFGTDLRTGPFQSTLLAQTALERVPRVRVGEAVLADFAIYIPGGGRSVLFAAVAVRSGSEVIGTLAVQVPVDALNGLTTAGGRWEAVGLGAGESYVVGADRVLRSERRGWLEDPEGYLEALDADEAVEDLIRAFGSPVGLQVVDSEAVEEALAGSVFDEPTTNDLGRSTFTYARAVEIAGVPWVVVVDVPLNQAREPLYDYLRRLAIVFAIVLPIAAIVGFWLASRLARPIPGVVSGAQAIAEGDRDPHLPHTARDEFGDLSRRLRAMAAELGRREAALEEEYERTRRMLLAVLPARIVNDDGTLADDDPLSDTATVVAATFHVEGIDDDDEELSSIVDDAARLAEALAEERDIERVLAGADRYLFIAGLGQPSDGADEAIDFAAALAAMLHGFEADHHGVEIRPRIGIATGPVATGVLQESSLSFGAWGEPVRRALAIGALAVSDEVLVDVSTAELIDTGRHRLAPTDEVIDLLGRPMVLFAVADGPADDGSAGADEDTDR
ncbi:MAG: adenylate/guanylate cyclase domain-containing protein [Acidimicrobiales bacterium]